MKQEPSYQRNLLKQPPKRARDKQRARVYAFDDDLDAAAHEHIGLDGATKLIMRVAAHYNLQIPKISDGRRRRTAAGNSKRIALPRWSRTTVIVLHECAHFVHQSKYNGRTNAAHGREFAAVYAALLVQFGGFMLSFVIDKLREHRVDFASIDLHSR